MKTLRSILLALLCLVMVVLTACPAPDVVGPGSTTTNNSGSSSTTSNDGGSSGSGSAPGSSTTSGSGGGTVEPAVPTGAVYRPMDTGDRAAYWKRLSAPVNSFAASAYTNAAEGVFLPQQVLPTADSDAAYGFVAPYDGIYEISADLLALAGAEGAGTLAVYKGTAKIWPLSEDSYAFTTQNGADRFTATTAAKKGDVIYIRASGDDRLYLIPRITLISGAYEEDRDLEKNSPTVGILTNVGSSLAADDFVMQPIVTPDTAQGTVVAANTVAGVITRNQAVEGAVYVVKDGADVTLDFNGRSPENYSCNGKGAVLVTAGKVTVKNISVSFSNITIIAADGVYLENGENAVLEKIAISGGLVVGKNVNCLDLSSCRIEAGGTALENKGYATGALNCYFEGGSAALVDTSDGEGLYLGCVMRAPNTAIDLSASSTTVRSCTVYGDIRSGEDVENLLVALCDVRAVGAIVYNKVHNSVVLLNEVENVAALNSTNVYVCENAIYGGLCFDNVRYLIAEDNTLANATPALVSVRDFNGDNVTDVTARADNGVNEDLLPHVNKDAFLMMDRKKSVRNIEREYLLLADYIREKIADNIDLIVPPGAYDAESGTIRFGSKKNANIYAYGVLFERATCTDTAIELNSCENVGIYGLTLTLSEQSSGQLQILKKLPGNKALAIVGAGISPTWNKSHEVGYRETSLASYGDLYINGTPSFDEATGLATISFDPLVYESIRVGDIITCRKGGSLTRFQSSSGIFLEDITIMGGAIRCFWDDYNDMGTTINRALDTRMPAKIIDEETYNYYKQIEQQYGVYTGVYIDELGNYRGAESRSATADFAHANCNRTGFQVSNTIIDGLTDDGTNNQGLKSRVYGYDIETGKVLIKGDATWGYGESISSAIVKAKAGDTIRILTIAGEMLVEEELLSGISTANKVEDQYYAHFYIAPGNETLAAAIARINPDSDNSGDFKLLCECPETNSPNATFDNVLFKNIRSRACLIKGNGVRIENCSFINIGMAAIALNYEPKYGEAGLPSDAVLRNNYFEGTGNYEDKKYYSPISVDAPAVQGGENYINNRNILIEGNVMRDRYTAHALYVSGSANVVVKNNDFGDRYDFAPTFAVYMDFVRDVEFSGNIYSSLGESAADAIALSNYVNVHGTDIDGVLNDRLVTDAIYTTTWVENIPYKEGDTVKYKGNWDAGCLPASSLNLAKFNRFNTTQGGGPMFFSYNNGTWDSSGAVSSIARDYRFVTAKSSNPVIRYTMDKDAIVAISISEFFPPLPPTDGLGAGDALFAIFVNDEMVWPTANGGYTEENDWYHIDRNSNAADINKSLANLTLELSEGDQILFVAKWPSWCTDESMFAAAPNIYYLG